MVEAIHVPGPSVTIGGGRMWVGLYMVTAGIVLLLMMLAGLWMRLGQAGWVEVDAGFFYELMTLHGTGMVGIVALGASAIMWHFLSTHLQLNSLVMGVNFVLFLIGVAAIIVADLVGGFGGAWTFLYPLPAMSQGAWPAWSAGLHMGGLLVIGVGFLIWCLEIARALIAAYGSLGRAHGWHVLFGGSTEQIPPPTVVAATMVTIVTTLSLIGGAAILIMSLVNLAFPTIEINPLLAKNLIYFFGHVFINATIYMGVIAVYELLPRMTGRTWKTSKVFIAAWTTSTVMVMVIFPHHLFMDFVMPVWVAALAQVLSYINSFPVLVVTGFGALTILHRSGIRWDLVSTLLLISMFGWMAGVIPAVVDATVVVNTVMHNTMWVPGHFHFYLLLGLLPMIFAFMLYLARGEDVRPQGGDLLAVLYLIFGLGFVSMFLAGGWASVPRRWAEHLPEWQIWDQIAVLMAAGVIAVTAIIVARTTGRILMRLRRG